jgi:hypothetical protein
MAKFTFHHVVAAYDDLSDAVGKLRETYTSDAGDKEISDIASAVPDYLAESTRWMKLYAGKISFRPEIEFKEPVEVITEAVRNARLAIQEREPRAAMKAFVTAAGACHHSTAKVFWSLPEEVRAGISAPPTHSSGIFAIIGRVEPGNSDVIGPDIVGGLDASSGDLPKDRFPDKLAERPPGGKNRPWDPD